MCGRWRLIVLTAILALALFVAPSGATVSHGRVAGPIYFFRLAGVLGEPRLRPSEIVFAADGNWEVTGLRWHGWGTGVARSDGTSHVNDCIPNCAQGTITLVPAHVTLSNPGRYHNREIYRCYHLYYTAKTSAPTDRGCLPVQAINRKTQEAEEPTDVQTVPEGGAVRRSEAGPPERRHEEGEPGGGTPAPGGEGE
jgi:hypothetical protein